MTRLAKLFALAGLTTLAASVSAQSVDPKNATRVDSMADMQATAGPDLIAAERLAGSPSWSFNNRARGQVEAGGSGDAGSSMSLRFPEFTADPDKFDWEDTAPGALLKFPETLDLQPWDVIVFEVTNLADTVGCYGVRMKGKSGRPVFMFEGVPAGQTERIVLNVQWAYPHFKSGETAWLLLHKGYAARNENLRFDRIRPAHRAVTYVWDVQDRLKKSGDKLPGDTRRQLDQRAQELLDTYWAGDLTGQHLEEQAHQLTADLDQQMLAAVRQMVADHATEAGDEGFVALTQTSMQRLPLTLAHLEDPRFGEPVEMWAAGRERESVQVAVVPRGETLREVSWSLSPLVHEDGEQQKIQPRARVVGYIEMTAQTRYTPVGVNPSWRADPLLEIDRVAEVPADELLPLWIDVTVPAGAAAGRYEGSLTLRASGGERQVPIVLHVWPFDLPEKPALRTALSNRYHPLRLIYGEDRAPQIQRKIENMMLQEYGLDPGGLYRHHLPEGSPPDWDVARLKELKDMGLTGINLGWVRLPRGKSLANIDAAMPDIDRQLDLIEQYLPTVDAAGVRDLAYIYAFDELQSHRTGVANQLAAHINQRFPGIPVMMTMREAHFGTNQPRGGDIDIYVPRFNEYFDHFETVERSRKMGNTVWWYTCVNPDHPYPNLFVDYPLIESRLIMGAMPAKYNPPGFLYYSTNRWRNAEAIDVTGPRTEFRVDSYIGTNADGILFYPGPDGPLGSVRLENMRDGMEDLAYYKMLRELIPADRDDAQVPEEVAASLIEYTRDPRVLTAERRRLAEAILKASQKAETAAK